MKPTTVTIAALAALAAALSAQADFVPTVLDRFDGAGSYTITQDNARSGGADNIAGANWAGFGATGVKSFGATFGAGSSGFLPGTVYGSMSELGGMLSLGAVVPAGSMLDGTSATPTEMHVAYQGLFNLSGKGGAFYFTFAQVSGPGVVLRAGVAADGVTYSADLASNAGGPRYFEIAFGALRSSSGQAYLGNGSNITAVGIGLVVTGNLTESRTGGLGEFGIVPTPATAALLGMAVAVPRRRRR